METLIAAIYVDSPNGRVGGVQSLTKLHGDELARDTYTTTRIFKTSTYYGWQPVTVGRMAWPFLCRYVEELFPIVTKHLGDQPDNSPLFRTFSGEGDPHLGKKFTSFFLRKLNIPATTTGMRDLVETGMKKHMLANKVTPTQRAAVMSINGHGSATVEKQYVLEERRADVLNSQHAFASLLATDDADAEEESAAAHDEDAAFDDDAAALSGDLDFFDDIAYDLANDLSQVPPPSTPQPRKQQAPYHHSQHVGVSKFSTPTRDNTPFDQRMHRLKAPAVIADWGTAHPQYHDKKAKKAKWTAEETQYVGNWCDTFSAKYPDAKCAVAKCLQYMRRDPAALPIFHRLHVANSARLRCGYRKFQDEQQQQQQPLAHVQDFDGL